ncbi:hypothetical protein PHMEG_00020750 [Phytophthora megakarya]|uniref:Uncharacterized protein n=1 Tax=Phytophthora megakarya TaxID=4795 RepID=A0A225VN34_9STRA|nr:hypothetical protein PHMEG_00020750 [Phytophthora megakarya]
MILSGKKSKLKPKKTPAVKAEKPAVKIHPPNARVISRGSSVDIAGLPSLILGKFDLVQLFKHSTTKLRSYVTPAFSRPGALACWIKLEEVFLPQAVPTDASIKCIKEHLAKFASFMNSIHPVQVQRQLWPDHACLFNTKDFELDSYVSQRASYPDRLLGIWRCLHRDSASRGVADYECKH